ncbi:MAG: hypothetical protein ACD_62C00264G0001 [uncultured bacterium]|nr:MAG: hypothetical protein ACD_62C00264G0001 [uncultured bacterium]HLD45175.1 hypothetical protein [bacterium]
MERKKLFVAIALSLFVLPGAGHTAIKQKKRGYIFSGTIVLLLILLVLQVYFASKSTMMAEVLNSGSTDVFALAQTTSGNIMQELAGPIKVYGTIFMIIYFGSVVDLIYLYKRANSPLGRWIEEQKREKNETRQ